MLSILNKVKGKWAKLTVITAALFALNLAFAAGTMYIAHPTEEHRQTAREIIDMSMREDAYSKPLYFETEEYRNLEASAENQYSSRVSFVVFLVGLAIEVVLLTVVYRYLRRYRVTKNAVTPTVLTSVTAGMLVSIAMAYVQPWFMGSLPTDPLLIGGIVVFSVFISLPITYLIVRVIKWNYERQHSFAVE